MSGCVCEKDTEKREESFFKTKSKGLLHLDAETILHPEAVYGYCEWVKKRLKKKNATIQFCIFLFVLRQMRQPPEEIFFVR